MGKFGEELAVTFLQKNGYEILETNWFFDKESESKEFGYEEFDPLTDLYLIITIFQMLLV